MHACSRTYVLICKFYIGFVKKCLYNILIFVLTYVCLLFVDKRWYTYHFHSTLYLGYFIVTFIYTDMICKLFCRKSYITKYIKRYSTKSCLCFNSKDL